MENSEQIVNPHVASAQTKFNYDILVDQFGLKPIDTELLKKIENITEGNVHHYIRRNIFYAHQDFDKILEAKAAGKEIYIYTGRGPSAESMHLGHLVPMLFTVWLQKIFDCYVVIEMSDEEKFYFKSGPLENFIDYTEGNAKDIIACGFNPEKTFIFSSFKYERFMRPLVAQLNKKISVDLANKIYGFNEQNNIGQLQWGAYEMAPAMCGAFPHLFGNRKDVMCLVPCAVDQAPYFRSVRDYAGSLGYPKPAIICSKFLVGLQGVSEKASTTGAIQPIFLNESNLVVANKIKKYAFSGGGETLKEHREKGANLEVDVPYIYLCHFLENDAELENIAKLYSSGQMLTSEIKKMIVDVINNILAKHQNNRNMITNELYSRYFTMFVRPTVKSYFDYYCEKYINIKIE
ncbi:Tryptophanyl tRNA-synthetase [Tupanvirus deep ocean]|uniref:Tryptophanyl tRNA-synthetase n=2 Tax=Tupanvirus TaxID=2094720 RepID=A0AC62A774_9VIRU|nr:Tryptophanyl tRNA-synthetase [Tupanvirus deep ocean]QKU33579.1 Tryptophanyl tRNA-synthetase [Tupanvirus deep ocean]